MFSIHDFTVTIETLVEIDAVGGGWSARRGASVRRCPCEFSRWDSPAVSRSHPSAKTRTTPPTAPAGRVNLSHTSDDAVGDASVAVSPRVGGEARADLGKDSLEGFSNDLQQKDE